MFKSKNTLDIVLFSIVILITEVLFWAPNKHLINKCNCLPTIKSFNVFSYMGMECTLERGFSLTESHVKANLKDERYNELSMHYTKKNNMSRYNESLKHFIPIRKSSKYVYFMFKFM